MHPFMETFESRLLLSHTPHLSPVQLQDLQALKVELQTIQANSHVTPAEWQAVIDDFSAIGKVAHLPSSASVQKLRAETRAVLASGVLTTADKLALADDVEAVAISAGVPSSLGKQTATDIKALVESYGVTFADVETIVADIKNFDATL